jgi:hypothetical protein
MTPNKIQAVVNMVSRCFYMHIDVSSQLLTSSFDIMSRIVSLIVICLACSAYFQVTATKPMLCQYTSKTYQAKKKKNAYCIGLVCSFHSFGFGVLLLGSPSALNLVCFHTLLFYCSTHED